MGTRFSQTAPEFIEAFIGSKAVKFVEQATGVFHPKVFLFEGPKDDWSCLIGSANFTAGGFGENSEIVLWIQKSDDPTSALSTELRSQIQTYWSSETAKYADAIPLEDYRYQHAFNRRASQKSRRRSSVKQPTKPAYEIRLLNMAWPEFFAQVKSDPHHSIEGRINVLAAARSLFRTYGSLASMPVEDQRGIAGMDNARGIDWGWFGRMKAAGWFKSIVYSNPDGLSTALDNIPPVGPVQPADFEAFVDQYKDTFPRRNGKPIGHGLATATRLLAMKRPDYFVCFDGPNKDRLSDAFGVSIDRHDYEGYWNSIIQPICESRWWNSRRPRIPEEAQVWDGRTAFLDSIFYAGAG